MDPGRGVLFRLVIDGVPQPKVGLYLPPGKVPETGDSFDREDGGRLLVEKVVENPSGGFFLHLTSGPGN
jgi:hypothetical protein